jgi:hypothetical protein
VGVYSTNELDEVEDLVEGHGRLDDHVKLHVLHRWTLTLLHCYPRCDADRFYSNRVVKNANNEILTTPRNT